MGFGPQINEIISNSEMPPKTQRNTLMFSATFPEEIQRMASQFLHDYLFLTVGRIGGTCSDVQQTIIQVPGSQKRNTLEEILQKSGIVFLVCVFHVLLITRYSDELYYRRAVLDQIQ